ARALFPRLDQPDRPRRIPDRRPHVQPCADVRALARRPAHPVARADPGNRALRRAVPAPVPAALRPVELDDVLAAGQVPHADGAVDGRHLRLPRAGRLSDRPVGGPGGTAGSDHPDARRWRQPLRDGRGAADHHPPAARQGLSLRDGAAAAARQPAAARSGLQGDRRPGRLAAHVGDAVPARLGRELDRLVAAVGLDVDEAAGVLVEPDIELALLDALVEPRRAKDQAPQPVDERAVRGADQLGPAVVDVLAERRGGIRDLAVDDEVDQILRLILLDGSADEAEATSRLLAALAEIPFVEREPQLAVFEHEVLAGAVVPASVHRPSASYLGFLLRRSD